MRFLDALMESAEAHGPIVPAEPVRASQLCDPAAPKASPYDVLGRAFPRSRNVIWEHDGALMLQRSVGKAPSHEH